MKAYRYLLYHAMVDIRSFAWMRFWSFRLLNPMNWRATLDRIRRAGVIADWLHNLALFSVLDFEEFDEARFWSDFRLLNERHPGARLGWYKDIFERELSGTGRIPKASQ
jgi:hypothetical protein